MEKDEKEKYLSWEELKKLLHTLYQENGMMYLLEWETKKFHKQVKKENKK